MSGAHKAVKSAMWVVATGMLARVIGLAGTLALTHFIPPGPYGQVMLAMVVVQTADYFSQAGVLQYIAANPKSGREKVFHVTVISIIAGGLGLGIAFLGRDLFCQGLNSPNAAQFVPGLVVAMLLQRLTGVPERVMVRDMRFRQLSIGRAFGELAYTFTSVGLAYKGYGALAIVAGNVARQVVRIFLVTARVNPKEWLLPAKLQWSTFVELFKFGSPLAIGNVAAYGARRWDNFFISRFFGDAVHGAYNLAYNLADVPAVQVGEQIGDVLLPSFARAEPKDRAPALVRATGLQSLIMAPLAVGLGAVAPTLIEVIIAPAWKTVAPMLALLAGLSVFRPIGWMLMSFLQAMSRTKDIMVMHVVKLVLLFLFMGTLGRLSPLWLCAAIGMAFALDAWVSLMLVNRAEPVPVGKLLFSIVRPLGACVPMVAAVYGTRYGLMHFGFHQGAIWLRLVMLVCEITAGALVFVPFAFLLCGEVAWDCYRLLKRVILRRKG